MGAHEYAGGPIIFFVLYAAIMMLEEDGVVKTLGSFGKGLWFLLKMYSMIFPIFAVFWLLAQFNLTNEFPVLSWVVSCAIGGGIYIKLMERIDKNKSE